VAIAVLVTFLAAQTATAARQAPCDPSPQVLAAAPQAGLPSTRDGFCATLAARTSGFSQGQAAQPPAGTDPRLAAFLRDHRDEVGSISFDRTFVFIGIVALLGLVPAWFLRRPDPQTREAVTMFEGQPPAAR